MYLLEFQAKRILAEYGIPVPRSTLLTSTGDPPGLPTPVVLKAQVPVGGRGKAGAIRVAPDAQAAAAITQELLSAEVKGHPVQAVLAEEQVAADRELYLALLVDRRANLPMFIASAAGGVDIETVAKETPEGITRAHVDPFLGVQHHTTRYLARALDLKDTAGLGHLLRQMLAILRERDASLVEINPLAETSQGLVALDAKMLLDDKAAHRHAELFATLEAERRRAPRHARTRAESLAAERGTTYVHLDGNVGLVADGAGTGMLTVDLIRDAGGEAADFCEMGGLTSPERMRQSIEVVLANPRVKVLLITLIGGLTRMDEMATGIAQYLEEHDAQVPFVVRMCGTQEEAGRAILQAAGLTPLENLPEAVDLSVALARTV